VTDKPTPTHSKCLDLSQPTSAGTEANVSFQDPKVVWKFMSMWEAGMVPKWETFSLYKTPHLKMSIALFDMFYFAKDFDTFYKVRL
jgi:hypothetical protein